MKKTLLVCSALFFLTSCSDDKDPGPTKKPGKLDFFKAEALTVNVRDEAGTPVAGAEILIGPALNEPFASNLLHSDAQGRATLPAAWQTVLPVTVRTPGFMSVTYLMQSPRSLNLMLKRAPSAQKPTLSGATTGYNIKDNDNKIDFGLVMKAMTKSEILAFDLSKFISMDNDKTSLAGQTVYIPSNVSLPRQRESYFIPITIDKNPYRMSFAQMGPQKVIALRGQFPFHEVVGELRNKKTFVDLINYFSIEGGLVQDVNLLAAQQTLNLDLSKGNFHGTIPVTAPNVGAGEVVIGVVAQNLGGGYLMPTDFKRMNSGQSMNLRTGDPAAAIVLKVLKRQSEFIQSTDANVDRLSAIYAPANQSLNAKFLNLVNNPKIQGQQVLLDPPKPVAGLVPYATYLVLSELQDAKIDEATVKVPLTRWEIYAPGWISKMDLPQRPISGESGPQWRWEVTFLGGTEPVADLGPDLLQKTTHVTRSSTDF